MRSHHLAMLATGALALAPLAGRAEEAAAPATTPAPAATPEEQLTRAVQAAAEAAKAAKEAAEASKASADALRATLEKKAEEQKAAPAPEPAKKEETKETPWVYNLGVNLISVTGNANAVTAKVLGQVTGKWGLWAASVKGSAAYGQTTVQENQPAVITAQNADLALRGDRGFTDKIGSYVTGGAATDRVASIRIQTFGEAGLGMTWFEEKEASADWVKAKLRSDFGFRVTHEGRQKYFPEPDPASVQDKNIFAPRATLGFRYALSKTAFFSEDAEILYDLQDSKNVRASSASIISAQLDKGIGLNLGFKVRYIGVPAADAKTTDTELSGGVSWTF